MSTLKERIRIAFTKAQLRTNGITQKALAEACGVTPPSVNQWFSGKTLVIDMDNAKKAAEYLGCDPVWLATGEGGINDFYDVDSDFDLPQLYPINSDKFRAIDALKKRKTHAQTLKEKFDSIDFDKIQQNKHRNEREIHHSTFVEELLARQNANNENNAAISKEPYSGKRADLFKQKERLSLNLAPLKNAIPLLNDVEKEDFFDVLKLALCESDEKTYLDYLDIILHHIESAHLREFQEAEFNRLKELREKLQLKSNKAKNE